jgi:hypothetical protein
MNAKQWDDWIAVNRPVLKSIGLPPEVCISAAHWEDFLENGHLHWHVKDSTGFEFIQLNLGQQAALKRFLERQSQDSQVVPRLLDFLRNRLGHDSETAN